MAKRLNIDRDTKKQLEYKAQLEEESRRLYGSVRCWACHKPYKGLIASHIKPIIIWFKKFRSAKQKYLFRSKSERVI